MICDFDKAMGASVHVRTCTLDLLFRVLAWKGWFKVDDCGISRVHFQPTWHVQVTLRHLSCARSFIAHKALYWFYLSYNEVHWRWDMKRVELIQGVRPLLDGFDSTGSGNYERANAASGASSFEFKGKIWVFAARPDPTRPHHAL